MRSKRTDYFCVSRKSRSVTNDRENGLIERFSTCCFCSLHYMMATFALYYPKSDLFKKYWIEKVIERITESIIEFSFMKIIVLVFNQSHLPVLLLLSTKT